MSYQDFRPGRFQSLPLVIKNLLIINGIMYLATILLANRINLYDYLGLHYFRSELFKPHQFVTYLFMHGSFMHIFFNMFAVWTFGSILEHLWGPKRFLIYYLVTGMGAGLIQYLVYYFTLEPKIDYINNALMMTKDYAEQTEILAIKNQFLDSFVVVGASGALFGLLIAFGMLFPNTELMILFLPIPIKAKYLVTVYGLIELVSGISNNPDDNVAHFAHLGGMLFGFIMLMIWKKNKNRFY